MTEPKPATAILMGQRVQLVSQWEDSANAKRVFMAENVTNVLLDTSDSVPMAAHHATVTRTDRKARFAIKVQANVPATRILLV